MAKKKDNTLLYAGIAAAAILLLKKKDTGMAGVGNLSRKDNLFLKLQYGDGLSPEEYEEYYTTYKVQAVTARGKNISYTCDSLDDCYKYKKQLLRKYPTLQLLTISKKYKNQPYEEIERILY